VKETHEKRIWRTIAAVIGQMWSQRHLMAGWLTLFALAPIATPPQNDSGRDRRTGAILCPLGESLSSSTVDRQGAPHTLPSRSITAWARASNFQHGRFLSSQWFADKATSAQTNSRAPSVVLNQIDDLWSPSTFHRARDRRSSCQILACHLVAHAKLRLSCGAHPR
jgi:hypothetical protein